MATTRTEPTLDPATAERMSARFATVLETLDVGDDLLAPDAFCDLNMPVWRFQLQGRQALEAQLRKISKGPSRVEVLRTVATASGFVQEHEEHTDVDGQDLSARRLVLCEVREGRISEVVVYCTGEWDDALRARHAVEAPMLRPWSGGGE
jgi:ketosteroid isomerase-like protein